MTLKTAQTVPELRRAVEALRGDRATIGLVTTMGALHDGHLSLVERAADECDAVVVSIFVNPTQFGKGEDFERYPRDERRDADLVAAAGADLLFAPRLEDVYPAGFSTSVEVRGLTDVLCGAPASRGAEHFRGVATVVTKLFNMCQPHVAYFGQKDYQQALVIKRLVRDLDIPVRIQVCPTVREPDGLAMSSRNAYLDASERSRALWLKRALDAAAQEASAGAPRAEALAAARRQLRTASVDAEYLEILRAEDLAEPVWAPGERVVVAVAATIGRARLIDNVLLDLPLTPTRRPAADQGAAASPSRAATRATAQVDEHDHRRVL